MPILAITRIIEIQRHYGHLIKRLLPLSIDEEFLRIVIYLPDGSNLRVTEEWSGGELNEYSYYWLTETNELIIGWDNAPHHKKLENFPHHKHIGRKQTRIPSYETTLEEVLEIIEKEIAQ